jgi:hypothetical protein
MFKQLLGCKHLLSTKQEGVEIQIDSAIIACMLIMLYTGGSLTKRTFAGGVLLYQRLGECEGTRIAH